MPGLRRNIHGYYKICTKNGGVSEAPGSTYEFPPLAECRKAFGDAMQQDFSWNELADWTLEPPPDADDADI